MTARRLSRLATGLGLRLALSLAVVLPGPRALAAAARSLTYINPIDLPYRFALADNTLAKGKSVREGADPMVVLDKGVYWLFASKSGGYWRSTDLVHWTFIEPEGFPVEDYAPTVKVIDGRWVLIPSIGEAIYVCDDPAGGRWRKLRVYDHIADPDLFVDADGKVYLYWGSSPDQPIYGVQVDPKRDFAPIGQKVALISRLQPQRHGWEARNPFGSDAQIQAETNRPWMEGATVNRHGGRYYLQYSAPATEMKQYADGLYVADKPLGPYRYAPYSPVSYKPTGFITSAGHGVTFQDTAGRYWRAVTMLIGANYFFERRLGLFPAGFLDGGKSAAQFTTNTYLGDYPQLAPGQAKNPLADNLAGWMLLSLNKSARASSSADDDHGPDKAFDEDVRTWWSAKSAEPGEHLDVDLGKPVRIQAVHINFADAGSTQHGRLKDAYRYLIEVSSDGQVWRSLVDRRSNTRDAPHDYVQLDAPLTARYARITNVHTPAGARFSISGLRFFGDGLGAAPGRVSGLQGRRDANRRLMDLSWKPSAKADFYIVRYGVRPDRLTLNTQVYGRERLTIPGLNTDQDYYFTVDAVNDSGVTRGKIVRHAD